MTWQHNKENDRKNFFLVYVQFSAATSSKYGSPEGQVRLFFFSGAPFSTFEIIIFFKVFCVKQNEKPQSEKKKTWKNIFKRWKELWELREKKKEPEKPHSLQSPITDSSNVFMGWKRNNCVEGVKGHNTGHPTNTIKSRRGHTDPQLTHTHTHTHTRNSTVKLLTFVLNYWL